MGKRIYVLRKYGKAPMRFSGSAQSRSSVIQQHCARRILRNHLQESSRFPTWACSVSTLTRCASIHAPHAVDVAQTQPGMIQHAGYRTVLLPRQRRTHHAALTRLLTSFSPHRPRLPSTSQGGPFGTRHEPTCGVTSEVIHALDLVGWICPRLGPLQLHGVLGVRSDFDLRRSSARHRAAHRQPG